MKPLAFLILFFFNIVSLKADYNSGWFIKFTIEKIDGKKIIGHKYASSAYFEKDSIKDPKYVINKLNELDFKNDSSISFFRNRIKYVYKAFGKTQKDTIYSLINESSIKTTTIKTIKINEMINFNALEGIVNELELKDTIWMKTKPVKFETISGDMVDYQLFFHEYNNEIEKIVKELKASQKNENQTQETDTIDNDYKESDDILPIIEKIAKHKVIVIATSVW